MALQVWLPLNGNLNNQGVATITTTGGIVDNGGKIGKCYLVTSSSYLSITESIATTTEWSTCFWMKLPSSMDNATAWENMFRYPVINTSGGSSAISQISWASYHNVKIFDDSNHQWLWAAPGTQFNYGQWHHWAITLTANGEGTQGKIYIDGNLVNTYNNTTHPLKLVAGTIDIGRGITTGGFYVNDFRVYDNCLSAEDIKHLAQGLILHYTCSDKALESTANLCTTGRLNSSTCYNGATNKYGYGTNTDIYKTYGTFQGFLCDKVYMGTNGLSAYPYIFFDYLTPAVEATRVVSFDYYPTTLTTIIFYSYSTSGSGKYRVDNGSYVNWTGNAQVPVTLNKWNHIEVVITNTGTATSGFGYMRIGTGNHTSNTSDYWLVANVQVEDKDHATAYAGPGGSRTASKIYDNSGFKNNGDITDSFTLDSTNPRYISCIKTTANTSKIHISNLSTSNFGNSYSFAWWGKRTSNSGMFWGFSDGIRLNGMFLGYLWNTGDSSNNPLYNIGTTTQVTAPTVNVWHHYVMTGNGTKCYVYLDGELWAEAKTYKAISGTSIYINGWDSNTNYSYSDVNICDFRIYTTALSARDVKSLYQNNAYIDANDVIYGPVR